MEPEGMEKASMRLERITSTRNKAEPNETKLSQSHFFLEL